MKLQFDANQLYQLRAVDTVASLFHGLVRETFATTVRVMGVESDFDSARFSLDPKRLLANVQAVQKANGLEPDAELKLITEKADIGSKKKQDVSFPNVSVEMETGTGKTYVYLRTAFELNKRHGLKKFIVVVPSVAVREGVLKTFQITQGHFADLYDNEPYRFDVYDSKNLNRLKNFAEDDAVRFLIMTIDSFNKEQNVIGRSRDQFQGRIGLHMLQAVRPVLILDEPQNMESTGSKQALARLNPLVTLRYSATHREAYNRVYRLSPHEAYRQGLVKKIEVASVVAEDDENRPFIRVTNIGATTKKVVAKIEVHERRADGGVKPKEYKFSPGDSLRARAERSEYEPYIISEIDPAARTVTFSNGVTVKEGQPYGADQKELFRQQIRYTIEQHFKRQEKLQAFGLKVLSLFFIDKVENYAAADGIVRTLFAEAFNDLKTKYAGWEKRTPEEVSGAYFAKKKRKGGVEELQDSSGGESEQDRDAYSLIMKEKERLLSFSEPVCFLFSHSALREGWDNPNVFQICTLNQSTSEIKKRQEIGRGLRLGVNQSGTRCLNEQVNALTVVANESYEDYVKALQKEIEEDFGADKARKCRPDNGRRTKKVNRKPFDALPKDFEELWNRIRAKTRYSVQVDTDALVMRVIEDLNKLNIEPPRLVVTKARVEAGQGDVFTALQMSGAKTVATLAGNFPLPNLVDKLTELLTHTTPPVRLTRRTLLAIIRGVTNQQMILDNPEEFASQAVTAIRQRLEEELVAGIQYEQDGTWFDMTQWDAEIETMSDKMIDAKKSLYERFVYDSDVERRFAEKLESMGPVKFYVKLPAWFKVPTPVGNQGHSVIHTGGFR
ncbi:dead deah box helicase : Type III restriction enzyme, res subunit:DEAD/DEAH box helicase, N-terminal OS=Nodularia spumigena CCY9414 GN=NSP_30110 PE=4 SV=1: ResIII [Gemmataceae bacterium]|nr:dead deah box helicase : Type III restriction enzyme, res subunit:DEAD/DEAH box helicase, N-terminal OS=Nodularia spumigena CCY9414 GN=NSP_30110 PE=4 SV=1: ResIII [Gemmataceae bacterium]VTT98154.1 dead deah box helicase : Type III restriction enzyme, res subunit:DEAD/DEAH box helicase, N-terminal OS=Nodularia spumigena CCY9414 GN=NSP_30110 PE=4 SV=1: ResIII [Gemmataceae bacterium]